MRAFIGLINENNYLIYDDVENQLGCLTAEQVKVGINDIWNLEIKNGKPVPIGVDISRFGGKQGPVPVAVKAFVNIDRKNLSKNNRVDSYLMVSSEKILKIKSAELIAASEMCRRKGMEMKVANLKFVHPEGKQPYVIALGAEIPIEVVDTQKDRAEAELFDILTCNMINGIVEVSERISSEINRKINTKGIEPLVKTLEDKGITYNTFKHADTVRKIVGRMQGNVNGVHVYYWVEYRADGAVNFTRYSCNKERLMIDMSKYLDNLGKYFKRELYKFGQIF